MHRLPFSGLLHALGGWPLCTTSPRLLCPGKGVWVWPMEVLIREQKAGKEREVCGAYCSALSVPCNSFVRQPPFQYSRLCLGSGGALAGLWQQHSLPLALTVCHWFPIVAKPRVLHDWCFSAFGLLYSSLISVQRNSEYNCSNTCYFLRTNKRKQIKTVKTLSFSSTDGLSLVQQIEG